MRGVALARWQATAIRSAKAPKSAVKRLPDISMTSVFLPWRAMSEAQSGRGALKIHEAVAQGSCTRLHVEGEP